MAEDPDSADRPRRLRQLVAALTNGVVLVEADRIIAWANAAALRMHGVGRVEELGATVPEYRERFDLRHRNRQRLPPGQHPIERALESGASGEVFVEVAPAGEERPRWTHRARSLVLTDAEGRPDCLALVLDDETGRFGAEERFERAFTADPAPTPAVILRLSDLRYVRANRGFLGMTGYAEEDVSAARSGSWTSWRAPSNASWPRSVCANTARCRAWRPGRGCPAARRSSCSSRGSRSRRAARTAFSSPSPTWSRAGKPRRRHGLPAFR